ncbi:hypothetical protein D3C71_2211320 [compost metagenome]
MSQAHRVQVLVPTSELRVIDGVGHIPHIEDPPAFESLLVRELRSADPAAASATDSR